MFTFHDNQRTFLAAIRATLNEGERRFEFWSRRQAQAAAAQVFGQTLAGSGLRAGQGLSDETRAELLHAAAALAPNGNLSRRLPAPDPNGFDDRLRHLLFGTDPLPDRLSAFLSVRGTGIQTASGLLCAFAPDTYPLVTRPSLRNLELTPAQRQAALTDAAERYAFSLPENGKPGAAQQLLALFIIYEAVRSALGLAAYPEVDAALRLPFPGLALTSRPERVRETGASYGTAAHLPLTETTLLTAIEEYAIGQGFTFPAHRLRSYYIALKTKPFAILSGVSGTGKTRMAELFAEAMTGQHPRQFQIIPVRPDWNDASALFGYHNPLANRYVSTPFLEIARSAALPENRQKTFFVCLDEMNLAQVEHYLADYLSALESRSHLIPLHEDAPPLRLPGNLFVTGTVNVDETTHGFSRKVLDRANTLEFDERPLMAGVLPRKGLMQMEEDLPAAPARRQSLFLGARIAGAGLARERLGRIDARFPERALAALQAINDLLYARRLHFAYRVRDDVLAFLAGSFDGETHQGLLLPDPDENFILALDFQILQKVLPRLHGQSDLFLPLLEEMSAWAWRENLTLAAAKMQRMRASGAESGYIRFYE